MCSEGREEGVWLEELCVFVWALDTARLFMLQFPLQRPLSWTWHRRHRILSLLHPAPGHSFAAWDPEGPAQSPPACPPLSTRQLGHCPPTPLLCHTPVMGKVGVADQGVLISCRHKSPQRALLSTYPECCDLVAENSRG